jgi:Holliday junction resolvase
MKESDIQKKILDYLKLQGAYAVKVIQASKAGVPDIICCYKGRFIAIEVKTPKTKYNTSELQKLNIEWIKEASGVVIVAWELEQIKRLMEVINDG